MAIFSWGKQKSISHFRDKCTVWWWTIGYGLWDFQRLWNFCSNPLSYSRSVARNFFFIVNFPVFVRWLDTQHQQLLPSFEQVFGTLVQTIRNEDEVVCPDVRSVFFWWGRESRTARHVVDVWVIEGQCWQKCWHFDASLDLGKESNLWYLGHKRVPKWELGVKFEECRCSNKKVYCIQYDDQCQVFVGLEFYCKVGCFADVKGYYACRVDEGEEYEFFHD